MSEKLNQILDYIKNTFATYSGKDIAVIEYVFQAITENKQEVFGDLLNVKPQELEKTIDNSIGEILKVIANSFKLIDSSEEVSLTTHILEEQQENFKDEFSNIIDAMLASLVKKNYEEKIFYEELWKIVNNSIFRDTEHKIYALYRIMMDARIPYFQIGSGLKMSNDEYKQVIRSKQYEVNKIRFILNSSQSQKTETASLVLKEIEKASSETEKTVLLSIAISGIGKDLKRKLIEEVIKANFQ